MSGLEDAEAWRCGVAWHVGWFKMANMGVGHRIGVGGLQGSGCAAEVD